MRKATISIILLAFLVSHTLFVISKNLKTERNDVSITISDPDVASTSLSIAVIGDPHLPEGREPLAAFRELLLEVKAAEPDLVLFVGDYIAEPDGEQLSVHRARIIEAMKLVDPVPRAVVLGNYETWSNSDDWLSEFARLGVRAMENEVTIAETGELYTWGGGTYGKLGQQDTMNSLTPRPVKNVSSAAHSFVQVECGTFHTIALSKLGDVFTFGFNGNGRLGPSAASANQPNTATPTHGTAAAFMEVHSQKPKPKQAGALPQTP